MPETYRARWFRHLSSNPNEWPEELRHASRTALLLASAMEEDLAGYRTQLRLTKTEVVQALKLVMITEEDRAE
jgi:hypothetical protein